MIEAVLAHPALGSIRPGFDVTLLAAVAYPVAMGARRSLDA